MSEKHCSFCIARTKRKTGQESPTLLRPLGPAQRLTVAALAGQSLLEAGAIHTRLRAHGDNLVGIGFCAEWKREGGREREGARCEQTWPRSLPSHSYTDQEEYSLGGDVHLLQFAVRFSCFQPFLHEKGNHVKKKNPNMLCVVQFALLPSPRYKMPACYCILVLPEEECLGIWEICFGAFPSSPGQAMEAALGGQLPG